MQEKAEPVSTTAPSTPPVDAQRPVLILTLDTTRADHLGLYGYFRDTSPNLDHLASMSLVFDDAIAPMATTLPTHLTLMTGLTPHEHGTTANIIHGGTRFVPSERVQTFAQLVKSSGYQTAGFVSATPLEAGTGVDRGFTTYDGPTGIERQADQTIEAAMAWLETADMSKPWLLWVHLYDPHNPYAAPEPWTKQFVGQGDQAPWLAEREFSEKSSRPTGQEVETVSANDMYDGEIRFMDGQIGRLMVAIAKKRVKPIILVVGDHGEGLGQHGQPGHGRIWNEQVRVPMMLMAPGVRPGRHAATTGVMDAIPTLLGRMNIPGSDAFFSQASGVDVLDDKPEERAIYSMQSMRLVTLFGAKPTHSLTTSDSKWVWTEGEGVVRYDRKTDPYELRPIDDPDALARVEGNRDAQLRRSAELGAPEEQQLSEETQEALKSLGYME